jgi:hypothetical protein
MKNLTFILVAIGLILPASADAAANRGSTDRSQSDEQNRNQPSQVSERDRAREQHRAAPTPVKGTVIVVDPNAQSITIADYITGSNRTFLADKMALINIKPGDRVNLTPQEGNSSRAHKVEKDESPRP